MVIKVTFQDKSYKYIKEAGKELSFVDDIKYAFNYQTALEFKVSWYLWSIKSLGYNYYNKYYNSDIPSILKFESIDTKTLRKKKIDLNSVDIKIKTNSEKLMMNPIIQQLLLMKYDSCHSFIILKKRKRKMNLK